MGYRTLVVTTEQIFNEFGSGSPDPIAIRDFVKMYYDKYRNSPSDKLKYLLLFGMLLMIIKTGWQITQTLFLRIRIIFHWIRFLLYVSDDFFGFLDDNEDINSGAIINYLDIGIGRVPAKNAEEAKNFVDKVEAYFSPQSFGPGEIISLLLQMMKIRICICRMQK